MQKIFCLLLLSQLLACGPSQNEKALRANGTETNETYTEPYRPQMHFSPPAHWMNDPNGMVFYHGLYHLFYQYYPDSTVWGPMHWGHATSADLVHWQHQPIALYPDSIGLIFSGSAVVDSFNTSGFGKEGKTPLIAIFTQHNMKGEKSGSLVFQNQSIAYSLDEGKTWTKYAGNPVLKNPGIKDFRDPKVMRYNPQKKWIMTLAVKDHVSFYSSTDFKTWKKESDFGYNAGAHGGVWECPDLFPLQYNGKTVWVLLVSINPGGPNKGSATQYFVGDFDGKIFKPFRTNTKWIDYGTDDYAGVTWNNTGTRKIFLGWMSNWLYATVVPTKVWRSANTVPRELSLKKVGEDYLLASYPIKELDALDEKALHVENVDASNFNLNEKSGKLHAPIKLKMQLDSLSSFSVILSNKKGERLAVGYDKTSNNYYIDRSVSGQVDFKEGFAGKQVAPRLSTSKNADLYLLVDEASVELFADDGLSVMTAVFFPNEAYDSLQLTSPKSLPVRSLDYIPLKSIWRR